MNDNVKPDEPGIEQTADEQRDEHPEVARYETDGAGYGSPYASDDDPTRVFICDVSTADENGDFPPCAE